MHEPTTLEMRPTHSSGTPPALTPDAPANRAEPWIPGGLCAILGNDQAHSLHYHSEMMNERALDHVGIAVTSLDEALPLWESLVGARGTGRERVESQGVEVVFIGSGAGRVELLAPTSPNSTVAKFLERRGPGMHHLCYRVPDIAAALEQFRTEGYELIDQEPRTGAHDHRIAFLHPRSTGSVLVELVEGS